MARKRDNNDNDNDDNNNNNNNNNKKRSKMDLLRVLFICLGLHALTLSTRDEQCFLLERPWLAQNHVMDMDVGMGMDAGVGVSRSATARATCA
jgi:hypothetical protein